MISLYLLKIFEYNKKNSLTGWGHSGDKAFYDENGEFFIVDRLKEVMKFQGHHVSPTEIEELLLSHPGVLEVAVVGVPNLVDGDHPMAFVKKVPDSNVCSMIEVSNKQV